MPIGDIDFDNKSASWVFTSRRKLKADEKLSIQDAARKIGILTDIDFNVSIPPKKPPKASTTPTIEKNNVTLITSNQLKQAPKPIRSLVEKDEDEWRSFLSRRSNQEIINDKPSAPSKFACLYDAEHCGESRLSELLTIYDRVDILPNILSTDWLSKHHLSLQDLQELVKLKRV